MTPIAAPTPTIEQLVPFWTELFGVPAEVFTQVWNAVAPDRRGTFARYVGGELVSTVQVYVLPFNGEDVGCVANVATHESARKQGLSSELLQEAIAWIEARGVRLSFLFTGVPHHYAKLGWAPVQGTIRQVESDAAPIAPNGADLKTIKALHSAHLPPFALKRNETWWNDAFAPRIAGRPVWTTPDAYVVANDKEGFVIEEAFGEENAVRTLVLGATAWAGGKSVFCGPQDIGTPSPREGGMLRGGPLPEGAWYSPLDYF